MVCQSGIRRLPLLLPQLALQLLALLQPATRPPARLRGTQHPTPTPLLGLPWLVHPSTWLEAVPPRVVGLLKPQSSVQKHRSCFSSRWVCCSSRSSL